MRPLLAVTLVAIAVLTATPPAGAQVETGALEYGRFRLAQEQEQEQAPRRTLLDILFGRRNQAPEVPAPEPSRPVAPRAVVSSPSIVSVDSKNPNATRLAVFGDSMAVGLSRGLARLYTQDPNIVVLNNAVGATGFVRDDYFDWNLAIRDSIIGDQFDLAVVIIGINDRQYIQTVSGNAAPLSDEYKTEYNRRIVEFLNQFRIANRPVIWVGLPPMRAEEYSSALAQISSLQRSAAFANGVEFVDIYERYVDEEGNYTPYGPDLSGQQVLMRLNDGIHWTDAGADRAAFFVDKAVRLFYRGGTVSIEVADPLAGSDAQSMLRPPYQGLGQIRLLEVAGLITSLNEPRRAPDGLIRAGSRSAETGIDLATMVKAPVGRADSFGVGFDPLAAPDLTPLPQ